MAAEVSTAHDQQSRNARQALSGRSAPSGTRADRLVELAEMTDRLARVMQADHIPIWLNRPLEVLDDEKPVEALARGDYRRVAKLIAELEYPGAS